MPEIEWREITGYPSYVINEAGDILNWKTGKPCAKWVQHGRTYDYWYVGLYYAPGKQKNIRLHRLIASAFIPNPLHLPEVNHKNGNTLDCHKDNLEWCTTSYNSYYKNKAVRNYLAKEEARYMARDEAENEREQELCLNQD